MRNNNKDKKELRGRLFKFMVKVVVLAGKPAKTPTGFAVANQHKGFALIETLVAMGIMIIIAATAATTVIRSLSVNRLGDEETEATLFAQEGIEAVRSIKKQGWEDPFLATNCTGGCGVDSSGGVWSFSGTANTRGKFIRQIFISDVYRDSNGNIVESGGTLDPDTKKVTAIVNWTFSPTRNNSVKLVAYLTNWKKSIGNPGDIKLSFAAQAGQGGITLYANAKIEGRHDTDGNVFSNDIIQGYGDSKVEGNAWAVKGINPVPGRIEITKDAHGSVIQYCKVKGDTYSPVSPKKCKVEGVINLAAAPTPIPLPEIDLDYWRQAAMAGGTIAGDYILTGNDEASLGPKVITGNVILDNKAKLTITGTLWIQGNLTSLSSSEIILDEAFGEKGTVILLDNPSDKTSKGRLILESNTKVKKTSKGGYILFVSANQSSDCSVKAAEINSNAAALAILAADGCVLLNSNAEMTALAAKEIILMSNAEVSYDAVLSSITYVPKP